ncbi:MAG: hypothetical protein NVV74_15900 [Magnetospirillum sp.]|nr:hypothetical protein [Magnetospirillum sp.]
MKRIATLLALSLPVTACTTMPSEIIGQVQPGVTTDTQISDQLGTRPITVRFLEDGTRHEVWAKRDMPNPFSVIDEVFAGDFTADGVLVRVTGFASSNPNHSAAPIQQAQK